MYNTNIAVRHRSDTDLDRLIDLVDERSGIILWYLYHHKHARISELRGLFSTVSDYDILYRLKEVINKKAQQIWDRPVVRFEESKSDPLTGEKVLFSWWLVEDESPDFKIHRKQCVDIFNEKDTVTIVAQLSHTGEDDDALARSENESLKFKVIDVIYKNGVLQISLGKERNKLCLR
jgi:hypothetical protein